MDLPTWFLWMLPFMIVFGTLILLGIVFWIWMLVDAITSPLRTEEKLLWAILIVFTTIIGAFIYFVAVKRNPKYGKTSKKFSIGKEKHLYRSSKNKIIAGVCGGLGEYFGVDPVIIRLLWVLLTLMGGSGIILYIIFWIIVPRR